MNRKSKLILICASVSSATFMLLGLLDSMIVLRPIFLLENPLETYGLLVLSITNGIMGMVASDKELSKILEELA